VQGLRGAERREAAGLQEPEQLGLGGGRHLADLVEEQRPAGRALDEAGLVVCGRRVRAPRVAVELALEEVVGEGGAVDRLERPLAAAGRVQGLGVDLLAHAGLARQQEIERRPRQPPQLAALPGQRRRQRGRRPERDLELGAHGLELVAVRDAEDEHVVGDRDHRPRAERPRPAHADAVHGRPVEAAEVLQEVAARARADDARVVARHRRAREVRARRAREQLRIAPDLDRPAQLPELGRAAGLARLGRAAPDQDRRTPAAPSRSGTDDAGLGVVGGVDRVACVHGASRRDRRTVR